MKKIWETGIILFSVMGFWGMIYPDLCFTQEVCQVAYEEAYAADNPEADDKDMFRQLCEAGPEQIRIRSRLWDCLTGAQTGFDGAEAVSAGTGVEK